MRPSRKKGRAGKIKESVPHAGNQHTGFTRVYVSFFRFQKQEERFELKSHEIKVSDPANELRDRGSRGIRPAGDFTSL